MTTTDNSNSMQSFMAGRAIFPALVMMISLLLGNAAFAQVPPAQVTGPVPAAAAPSSAAELTPPLPTATAARAKSVRREESGAD